MEKGNGYIGSPALMTSKANEQVVPETPGWSFGYSFYMFEFENDQDCTVIINGNTIFLRAGRGFITPENGAPVKSFIIKEPNITYTWAAAY